MQIEVIKGGFDRNRSYIIYDEKIRKAIVIDPFYKTKIYFEKAKENNFEIAAILNTHSHRDHVEGNEFFAKKEILPIDLENKNELDVFGMKIKLIRTPGHCDDSVCYFVRGNVFTGDTLFTRRVGMTRTIENSRILYESLKKLKILPDETKVWPGHEYAEPFPTTIGEEKRTNPYLKCKSWEEFENILGKWRNYQMSKRIKRRLKWIRYRYFDLWKN